MKYENGGRKLEGLHTQIIKIDLPCRCNIKMKIILQSFAAIVILKLINGAPIEPKNLREGKNLDFLDYIQPEVDYNNFKIDNEDYVSLDLEENDISRAIPPRKPLLRQQPFNSPIYYIRLPPQPYMFVPGIGYVSQPAPSPMSQFVNLPMSFVSNGKPSSIYQWSGAFQGFPTQAPPTSISGFPSIVSKPHHPIKKPLPDSTIHRLPEQFAFNGKPEDIFVLRDSYNSLYSDVLQNVYP
ncbi:hypothetical protein JTB14_002403 [Gonioctena quinquepunctata]|nr:hypothetical protein JTB14_002403 [Gonioctena quinquepunctata]